VLAVSDFENKASFNGQWNLGQGMAEVLTAELVESERVEVLERQHLGDVVGEIVRQGQDLFRKEGKVERGRLKNAQYLVRGVVTDFTVTGDSSGWFAVSSLTLRGRGSRARVAISLKVQDVASGQVISAVKTEAGVSAGGFGGAVNYKGVAFGGDAFFRTPLGKATEKATARAVKKILHDLPVQVWQARVAELGGGQVIVNGGENVGLREGDLFAVRGAPRDVTDPATGNVIESVPGSVTGRLLVKSVNETSAHAVLLQGAAQRGDFLEKVD
jgi:curli biogenesis system outer membrane secretion channel CsgG